MRFKYIFAVALVLFLCANVYAQRCQATTKRGTQCKRNVQSGSVYCWQHERIYGNTQTSKPAAKDSPKQTTVTQDKGTVTTGRCQATTKKGTQCKRNAKAGSKYCWQHGG